MENIEYNEKAKENTKPPGYIEAICSPYYRFATWTAVLFAFFTQASGFASLNLYSNKIIQIIISEGNVNIPLNWATNGVGLFQLAGAVLAPTLSTKAPTRLVIILG